MPSPFYSSNGIPPSLSLVPRRVALQGLAKATREGSNGFGQRPKKEEILMAAIVEKAIHFAQTKHWSCMTQLVQVNP